MCKYDEGLKAMDEKRREIYLQEKEEEKQQYQDKWRLTAGLADFLSAAAGVAVCLILVLLIVSLLNWLSQDAQSTFAVFIDMFRR